MVAAVGSAAKAPFVREMGADEVMVYDDPEWGAPVDVVLDAVGGDLLPRAVAALRPGGRLIFLNSGGGTVPAYDLLAGAKTVTGLTMRAAAARRGAGRAHDHRGAHQPRQGDPAALNRTDGTTGHDRRDQ